jgi:oligosaccharide repeat unit polymerase
MGDSNQLPHEASLFGDGLSFNRSGLLPATEPAPAAHRFIWGIVPPRHNLPLYCHPVALFLIVWALMLACLSVHVSYVIYPYFRTPLLIFAIATLSLLLGYFASSAVLDNPSDDAQPSAYSLDVTVLRRLNLLLCVLACSLVAFNWLGSGPPPAISDPSTYLIYGKFKQVLYPLLSSVAVNATLDPSRSRRYLFILFALSVLTVYVARGVVLLTFLEMFFLFTLRSNMSRKKRYWLAAGALTIAIAGMTIFGNLRTAHDIFIDFLEIQDKYSDWPMAWLWLVSYISIPFSNLCWMVAHAPAHGPTLAFLYPLLPAFMAPSDPYADVHGRMTIIDNASTYLETYALDFSYLGIYFANLLLGFGCGWLKTRSYPRHILVLSIYLTAMSLIFFTDMFLLLSTIIQVLIQYWVQKRCFRWVS